MHMKDVAADLLELVMPLIDKRVNDHMLDGKTYRIALDIRQEFDLDKEVVLGTEEIMEEYIDDYLVTQGCDLITPINVEIRSYVIIVRAAFDLFTTARFSEAATDLIDICNIRKRKRDEDAAVDPSTEPLKMQRTK